MCINQHQPCTPAMAGLNPALCGVAWAALEGLTFAESIEAAQTIAELRGVPLADVLDALDRMDPDTLTAVNLLASGDHATTHPESRGWFAIEKGGARIAAA